RPALPRRPFRRPLVDRPVCDRIGERHADLHDVGPAARQRPDDGPRPPEVRVARRDVRDERAATLTARRGERPRDPAARRTPPRGHGPAAPAPSRRATSATSLSPRPDRLTITSDPDPPSRPSRSRY